MRRTGGCECGAVRFEAETRDVEATICHCGQCRRWSGYLWASIVAADATLRIGDNGSLIWCRSSPAAERGFCRDCGSSLFWREIGSGLVDIALGSLDDLTGVDIAADIFAKEAPPQYRGSKRPRHEGDRSTPLLNDDDP